MVTLTTRISRRRCNLTFLRTTHSQGNFQHPGNGAMNGSHYSSPNLGDLFIESQDVDMSDSQGGFAFPGSDMIPWLEYLPQDVLNYFADNPNDEHAVAAVMPGGPGLPQGEGH